MFGGMGLLRGMIAALGAALFVGNVAALVRPPKPRRPDPRRRGPKPPAQPGEPAPSPGLRKRQAIGMALLGFVIFTWALASLLTQ